MKAFEEFWDNKENDVFKIHPEIYDNDAAKDVCKQIWKAALEWVLSKSYTNELTYEVISANTIEEGLNAK